MMEIATEAERSARALALLASATGQRGKPRERLATLLPLLAEAIGADGLGFMRREGEEMVDVFGTGAMAGLGHARSRLSSSLAGVAVLSRNVALSPDTRDDPRVDSELCKRSGMASLVAVPIDVSGAPAAALLAGWRSPNAYSEVTIQWLRLAAAVIESSIARHLLAERGESAPRTMVQAFSQREHSEAEQRGSAEIDGLTGLVNRGPFETALKASIHHWSPSQGGAVLFVDLDDFKRVNETHGHAAGDAVLQRVAEILRRCTRGHDVVSRLGDDDFAVLLNRLGDPAIQAAVAAERIVDSVLADNLINEAMPRIRLSIGAALIDRAGLDAGQVVAEALAALNAEKSERR